MTNIVPYCFPHYSVAAHPEPSLKQNLRTIAQKITCLKIYTCIKSGVFPFLCADSGSDRWRIVTAFISTVLISTVLLLLLYPFKLAILAISLCLRNPETPPPSPMEQFLNELQQVINGKLHINLDALNLVPEESAFLKSFLRPTKPQWEVQDLAREILELYPDTPEPWQKIIAYLYSKFLREPIDVAELSYEGAMFYSVLQKLTQTLQNPNIPREKKLQILEYIGSYSNACAPTWIEVIFRELTNIYCQQEANATVVLNYVQMFKENLLQSLVNRFSEEWHHISSFKHYHGIALGLNTNALARIQFTSYLIQKKRTLYDHLYKRFLATYKLSPENLTEYVRCHIYDSPQNIKNALAAYLCEQLKLLNVEENAISSVLYSIFYEENYEINTCGTNFILITMGILTPLQQTSSGKILQRLHSAINKQLKEKLTS
ncbi:DUF1548 domain-containing protein [Chlamydia vaughanii]|uniref:DUF1548 domain-containing protein n=1 Tax=Chlamydia vaughanii TaxID=3112552 RepID=UPI0032B2D084